MQMKRLLLFLTCMLMLFGVSRAAESVVYTLTPANGTNSAYDKNCDITIGGITWNLEGNAQMTPWRLGGKSLNGVDRALYSKTALEENVTKVEMKIGAMSSITLNTFTFQVSKDSEFKNIVYSDSPSIAQNSTTTFAKPEDQDWSGCYYKFQFNVTVSISSSNGYIQFSGAEFYADNSTTDPDPDPDPDQPSTGSGEEVTFDFTNNNNFSGIPTSSSTSSGVTSWTYGNYQFTSKGAYYNSSGYMMIGKTDAYLQLPVSDKVVESITITTTSDVSTNVIVGLRQGSSTNNLETYKAEKNGSKTFTISNGEPNTTYYLYITNNYNFQLATLTIKYKAAEGPGTLEPAGLGFAQNEYTTTIGDNFTSPTLKNPNDLTVSYESSNPNVATVEANGTVTVKAVGVTTITATSEATDKYKAGSAQYTLTVVPGDKVLSVSEALEAMNNGYTVDAVQVIGKITKIDQIETSQYGNATYTIADLSNPSTTILVYRGYWLEGGKFTAGDELKLDDVVTVEGKLVNYNGNTPEITESKVIKVEREPSVQLEFSPELNSDVKVGDKLTISSIPEGATVSGTVGGIELVNRALPYEYTFVYDDYIASTFYVSLTPEKDGKKGEKVEGYYKVAKGETTGIEKPVFKVMDLDKRHLEGEEVHVGDVLVMTCPTEGSVLMGWFGKEDTNTWTYLDHNSNDGNGYSTYSYTLTDDDLGEFSVHMWATNIENNWETKEDAAEATYNVVKGHVATPTVSVELGSEVKLGSTVTIDCETPGATISLMIGDEVVEGESFPYVFTFNEEGEDLDVLIYAERENWEESEALEGTYTVVGNPLAKYHAIKVTKESQLVDGGKYVLVGYTKNNNNYSNFKVISGIASNSNFFDVVDASFEENGDLVIDENTFVLNLGVDTNGKYFFKTNDDKYVITKYTSKNNQAGLSESKTTASQISAITLNEDGTFTIKFESPESLFKYNPSNPRFAAYASGQNDPYIYRLVIPVDLTWSQNENDITEEINENTHFGIHKVKHIYTANVEDKAAKALTLNINCYNSHNEETPEVVALTAAADKADEHYTVEDNTVTFKAAGEYTIEPTFEGTDYYAEPLGVTIQQLKVKLNYDGQNIPWNATGTYNLGDDLLSIDDVTDGTPYNQFVTVEAYAAWDNAQVEDAKTAFEPLWLYDQMIAIMNGNGVVDGYLTATPTATLNDDNNLVVTASCSGMYSVTFTGVDDGVVFENNKNVPMQSVDFPIAPVFTQKYTYTLGGKQYTNNGLNIDGAEVDVDSQTVDILEYTNRAEAPIFVPGVYLATLGYEISKAVDEPAETAETTIGNGGIIDLTGANGLTLTMTKNGVTTEPLKITLQNSTTGVEVIGAEEGEAEYYNLQGVKIANPEKGIYIKVVNGKSTKVIL